MRDYWYYGLCLRTGLMLPGLPAWPESSPRRAERRFVLRQDAVPDALPGAPGANPRFVCDGQGRILIRFPQLFSLFLEDENQGVLEIAPELRAGIESYLLSYIAGVVLHRRRILPLHASCVLAEGRAIVISGHSGQGKSTLATALTCSGHGQFLSDDITVIEFDPAGRAMAVPGSPHPRLTAESARVNAIGAAGLRAGPASDDKQIWYRDAVHFDPVPVAAVIRLDIAPPGEGPALVRLTGPGAVLPLQELVYRFALGRRLGAAGGLAHGALRLAASTPVFRLARSRDFAALGETVAMVLAAAGAAPLVGQNV